MILQHNQGSSKFRNKGFDFYDEMLQLVPHKAQGKGQHGYNPGVGVSSSHVRKNQPPAAATATTPGPDAGTGLPNMTQSPSSTADPDSIAPSTPSSYLAPSSQSNATGSSNISQGKRKAESIASTTSSSKHARPQSLTVQAQLDGSAAMQNIATAFKDISRSFDYGTTHPPETDLSRAVALLCEHKELSLEDVVTLSEYFSQPHNLNQATIFRSMPTGAREIWLQRRLNKFRAMQF